MTIIKGTGSKALPNSYQPESELVLGRYQATQRFVVHTKAPALSPGSMTKQNVLDGMEKSLKDLGTNTVRF